MCSQQAEIKTYATSAFPFKHELNLKIMRSRGRKNFRVNLNASILSISLSPH